MNLNLIAKVLIICLGLLEAVSSTPQPYTASDGHEYLIEVEQKFNWFQAWHKCAGMNSPLVEIDSDSKNSAIIDLLEKNANGNKVWIGGTDEFSSSQDLTRKIVWSATGNQFDFTYWKKGQPDNSGGKEHCVNIEQRWNVYKWGDLDCETEMGFICEVKQCDKQNQNCDTLKQIASSMTEEVVASSQMFNIYGITNAVAQSLSEFNTDIEYQLTVTEENIKRIVDKQQNSVKSLLDETEKQVNDLEAEIEKSVNDIGNQFHNKLSGKQDEIDQFC